MNNVKKTIGWADYSVNPVKGKCPVGCSYCYARRLYDRHLNGIFKDPSIRYDPSVFFDTVPDGNRIFVGSTIDLFHPRCSLWNDEIIDYCARDTKNTFIFLTKCPQNLPREWPDNCWVGVSATDERSYAQRLASLIGVDVSVKFISFEPLLGKVDGMLLRNTLPAVNWVIIGAQTPYSVKTTPKIEWVKEIVEAADKTGVPVFLKDNLRPLILGDDKTFYNSSFVADIANCKLRQEFPAL